MYLENYSHYGCYLQKQIPLVSFSKALTVEWFGLNPSCSLVNLLFILTKSDVMLSTKFPPQYLVFTKALAPLDNYLSNINFVICSIISKTLDNNWKCRHRGSANLKDNPLNQFCIITHEALVHCCSERFKMKKGHGLLLFYVLPHSTLCWVVCHGLLILSQVALSSGQIFKKFIFHRDLITYFPFSAFSPSQPEPSHT